LVLPIGEFSLVLPHAAVAEVVPHRRFEPMVDAPDWVLGWIAWRDKRVPLVSFEAAVTRSAITDCEPRSVNVVVLPTLNEGIDVKFVGILLKGVPRLTRLRESNISNSPTEIYSSPLILREVLLGDVTALIPDVDALALWLEPFVREGAGAE
jgi:chemosensory pili system protein ChpC